MRSGDEGTGEHAYGIGRGVFDDRGGGGDRQKSAIVWRRERRRVCGEVRLNN